MQLGDLRSWIEKAERAERDGDAHAAADALERWVAEAPDDPQVWKRLARAYQDLDRYQETLAALVRAATLYTDAGAGIQAIAVCRWILEVDPTHTATLDRLAELRDRANQPVVPSVQRQAPATPATARRSDAPVEEVLLTETLDLTQLADADGAREIEIGPIDTHALLEPEPAPPRRAAEAKRAKQAPAPGPPATEPAGPSERSAAQSLVATPLFGRLGAGALRKLIAASRLQRLAEAEVLFRQGDPPDALYVVVEGAVVPIAEGETRRRLSVLEAGDYFGEIALVTDQPRNATIEALVDTQLLAIDRSVVRELIDGEPEMLAVLLRFLRERLVSRLFQTSPVFAALEREQREELTRHFRLLEIEPDTILIEQGRQADGLYVVMAGELRAIAMENDSDKELAVLGAGAPCGEISLLRGAPAMASIVATRRSWVLLLPREEFERASSADGALRDGLRQIANHRIGHNLAGFDSSDLEML